MSSRRQRVLTALGLIVAFAILSWWLMRPRPLPDTLLPIRVGDRWGAIDTDGHIVIPPQYATLRPVLPVSVYRWGDDEYPTKYDDESLTTLLESYDEIEDDSAMSVPYLHVRNDTPRRVFTRSWPFVKTIQSSERQLISTRTGRIVARGYDALIGDETYICPVWSDHSQFFDLKTGESFFCDLAPVDIFSQEPVIYSGHGEYGLTNGLILQGGTILLPPRYSDIMCHSDDELSQEFVVFARLPIVKRSDLRVRRYAVGPAEYWPGDDVFGDDDDDDWFIDKDGQELLVRPFGDSDFETTQVYRLVDQKLVPIDVGHVVDYWYDDDDSFLLVSLVDEGLHYIRLADGARTQIEFPAELADAPRVCLERVGPPGSLLAAVTADRAAVFLPGGPCRVLKGIGTDRPFTLDSYHQSQVRMWPDHVADWNIYLVYDEKGVWVLDDKTLEIRKWIDLPPNIGPPWVTYHSSRLNGDTLTIRKHGESQGGSWVRLDRNLAQTGPILSVISDPIPGGLVIVETKRDEVTFQGLIQENGDWWLPYQRGEIIYLDRRAGHPDDWIYLMDERGIRAITQDGSETLNTADTKPLRNPAGGAPISLDLGKQKVVYSHYGNDLTTCEISAFGDQLLAVRTHDDKWCVINRANELILPPEFYRWASIRNEIGVLENTDRLLYIRADGSVIWDSATYEAAE